MNDLGPKLVLDPVTARVDHLMLKEVKIDGTPSIVIISLKMLKFLQGVPLDPSY